MKIFLAIVLISISAVSTGRGNVPMHFNNVQDRIELYEKIQKEADLTSFQKILEQTGYADLKLEVVFYDPKIKGMIEIKLDAPEFIMIDEYVADWINAYHASEKKVLLYFVKQNSTYTCDLIYVSENVTQLPPLVTDFIRGQIINKETSVEKAVGKGINAIKNAFDPQFKNRLVEMAEPMFDDNQYYKGYSCIDFAYYFFEKISNPNPQTIGCNLLYYSEFDTYSSVSTYEPSRIPNQGISTQSIVMDFYAGKSLAYKFTNLDTDEIVDKPIISDQNVYYSNEHDQLLKLSSSNYNFDYFDFSQPSTKYTGIKDFTMPQGMKLNVDRIVWNQNQFKEWVYNNALNSPLLFELDIKACVGSIRVKVFDGIIKAKSDPVEERHGISTYGSHDFRNAQPTWCNVFARVLSRKVFGHDAFPAKSCSELVSEEFTVKPELYVQIPKDNKNEVFIWDLINRGYPVYFITSSHIETGFPDRYAYSSFRHRHENDKRYDEGNYQSDLDSNRLIGTPINEHLVVGAGNKVGFKEPWEMSTWLSRDAKVYLYLGYLKHIYK